MIIEMFERNQCSSLDGVESITGDTSDICGVYFIWKYDRSSGIVSRIDRATPATRSFSCNGGQATAFKDCHPFDFSFCALIFFSYFLDLTAKRAIRSVKRKDISKNCLNLFMLNKLLFPMVIFVNCSDILLKVVITSD